MFAAPSPYPQLLRWPPPEGSTAISRTQLLQRLNLGMLYSARFILRSKAAFRATAPPIGATGILAVLNLAGPPSSALSFQEPPFSLCPAVGQPSRPKKGKL